MSKNLMDHVLMNKLDDEIGSAIEQVGGDISGVRGPWDYAEIIKDQLCVKGGNGSIPSMDIKLGPGLKIEEVDGEKYILATSAALTTCSLNPPTGSYMRPIGDVIEAGTPIQKVLESLFYEILPKMPSLFKGDIIRADKTGSDKYNEEDVKSGLVPNSVYLRLYITSRQEPIYILLSGHGLVNSESGSINPGTPSQPNEYIGGDSEYIHVDVVDNIITASLTQVGLDRFSSIESELNKKASNDDLNDLMDIVNAQTTSINDFNIKLGALQETVEGIDTANFATKAELDALQETVEGIDTANFATKAELESVETTANAAMSDVRAVQDNLKDVNISELNNTVEVLKTEVVTKEEVSIIVEESVNEVIQTIEIKPDPIPEDVLNDILV